MLRGILVAFGVVAAACAHPVPAPDSFVAMHARHDWQNWKGERLQAAMSADTSRIAAANGRAATLELLSNAAYDCTYGEGHADYPEPGALCARSFATRACQFDWEVFLTSDPARPDSVESAEATFRRDCVGTAADWPDPIVSAIDDQLAPSILRPEQPM